MYILVIFLPLVGHLIGITLGRLLGIKGFSILAIGFMFISWCLSWVIYYEVSLSSSIVLINLGT